MILLAVALIVVVAVLPSALNLPQANPTNVLEYAPVPPQDEKPPPVTGNLSALGLSSSSSLVATVRKAPPPPPPSSGAGARPSDKHCIGNPPRQTEDPASPPCVPYFAGDNFGATYQGVTRGDIVVAVYLTAGNWNQEETPPPGTFVDIDAPRLQNCTPGAQYTDPKQCDHGYVRALRALSRYFNNRYQTYGRHVHFWAFFSDAQTAANRRGDAVSMYEARHPFAALDEAQQGGFNQEFEIAMTQLSVLAFSSISGSLPSSFYRKVAPLAWGFYPDVEHWADHYASYVCQKVNPYPVRRFGDPPGVGPPNGTKRRIGLWYTTDPGHPEKRLFADIVKRKLQACGASVVEQATFSHSGDIVYGSDTGAEASQGVAKFQSKNVSTVLYMGGVEGKFATAADAVRYYPELIVAGDLFTDGQDAAAVQDQNVWQNAWGTTFAVREGRQEEAPWYRAYKEGDPSGDNSAGFFASQFYRDFFMLFEAIQVAGPRLTPDSVDRGFHAIPEKTSSDPFSPAFYFDRDDYTSVKDEAEQWWDPRAQAGGTAPGCYRMVDEGRRSLANRWHGGDVAFKNTSDPCTRYSGGISGRV